MAGPVAVRGVVAAVVSAMNGRVRVYSSAAGARVRLDGRDAGTPGPGGLELPSLAPGAHKMEILAGGVRRELTVEAAGAPALGVHAVAPGGEVALEVGDQVARRVPEGTVGEWDHRAAPCGSGWWSGDRESGLRNGVAQDVMRV